MKKHNVPLCLIVALSLLITSSTFAQKPAYLRSGDHIVFIGDSITEFGYYGKLVHEALQAAYPDQGLVAASQGSGGKTAAAGMGLLNAYMAKDKPTIVCVMFGVNDTGWAASGAEQKAAAFARNLESFIAAREKHGFELVFLRTSDFSHNASPDGWVDGLNKTLAKLFEAQDALAKENNIPVIDGYGAYRSALSHAWEADPLYEFTPDVVHPLMPGCAALAAEILRAFGAGLPLAKKERGLLRTHPQEKTLSFGDDAGIAPPDGDVKLKISNGKQDQKLILIGAPASLRMRLADAAIPSKAFTQRVTVEPVLAWTAGKGTEAFGSSLLHISRIHNLGKQPFTAKTAGFKYWAEHHAGDVVPCPVADLEVKSADASLEISFKWSDTSVVPASPGFKTRFGQDVATPLNLMARTGDQPCDAVEIFLDLRPDASAGRFASSVDGVSEGIVRIGVYLKDTGTATNAAVQVHPEALADKIKLTHAPPNTYTLSISARPEASSFGFNAIVTDKQAFKGGGFLYHLGGAHPQDPLGYVRLGLGVEGLFYRVGY